LLGGIRSQKRGLKPARSEVLDPFDFTKNLPNEGNERTGKKH
jgi:hypothetical protein